MPRGDGRWSRAGQHTGRRIVLAAPVQPPWHHIDERITEEMKKSFSLRALEPDMQKVVRRARKLGAEIQPTKHGACVLHLPDDPGNPIYVPKGGAPGTLTDLMDALTRYENGERAGAVNTHMPTDDEEENDVTVVDDEPQFDFGALEQTWHSREHRVNELEEENRTLRELVAELEGQVDILAREKSEALANAMTEEQKALLEAAKSFASLLGGDK